jgi:hypothetical protein
MYVAEGKIQSIFSVTVVFISIQELIIDAPCGAIILLLISTQKRFSFI